jgi:hypothetical protein
MNTRTFGGLAVGISWGLMTVNIPLAVVLFGLSVSLIYISGAS